MSEKKEFIRIHNTIHFTNGQYEIQEDVYPVIIGSIYEYHDIVGVQFNRLKGKLFNLIEASTIDEKQRQAMKGLVKDFCNSQYNNVIGDLEYWITNMGFIIEKTIPTCEPLGSEQLK